MILDQRLVIKQLSKHGELLDCINCFPGKVTVLYAETNANLLPFRQAISDQVSGRKFSVTYNGKPFISSEHKLIGFEGDLSAHATVRSYFAEFKLSDTDLESLLTSFGLFEYANTPLTELPSDHCHRVEILAGCLDKSKILILDSPFDALHSTYKRKFADLLLNDAVAKDRIILITSVNIDRDLWIDTTNIDFIQVGSAIDRTVGYGSGRDRLQEEIQKLRNSLLVTDKGNDKDNIAKFIFQPHVLRRTSLALSTIALALLLIVFSIQSSSTITQDSIHIASTQNTQSSAKDSDLSRISTPVVDSMVSPTPPNNESINNTKVSKEQEGVVTVKADTAPMLIKTTLDFYPVDVKREVIKAFRNQGRVIAAANSAARLQKRSNVTRENTLFDSLRELKSGSTSSANAPYLENHHEYGSDMSERQEEIRRRFLEALQRASDQAELE